MTDMTDDEARTLAETVTAEAMRMAHPEAADRQLDLERATFALNQAEKYAASDRFGHEHMVTAAYRAIAAAAARSATVRTQERLAALLTGQDAPPTDAGQAASPYVDAVPDFADLMTVEEFRDHVECGGITDSDGSANAVRDGLMARDDMDLDRIPADATHVAWFNK